LVATPGFYPPDQIGQDYSKQFSPVMLARLATAARRLAWMLDNTARQPRSSW
jgi:hypothetical protein